MPVPEFVVALRSTIGHAPLPLSGVIAVVLDEGDRVLLVRRSDSGEWALPTGCLEPGEQPADGALREVFEETGVRVRVERLLSVEALDLSVAPNGDQVYWLAIGLRCRLVEGEARVNDDESVEVGWFAANAMPPLPAHQERCLSLAVTDDAGPWIAEPMHTIGDSAPAGESTRCGQALPG
ncbi:NUDIX hydrolase [Actinoplanes ianthinogenes]|uniref:NUDIX hydrolase n=1 Tax=Actinoplanes ianthinogenes TaxID=122358 RepID=A0ABN6CS36_9ACTN|nr:NUDIX domain-containing protein [Actinoplanes ianthinogenes]BCJ48058.1 NUDIX hydrolase [Actinoplanes ianthinogenes]GGR06109.1 NUDIX hydrolase [Actinoplanes ianthinogenes]